MVSVIIPTYNRAELIGATLDSIIAQTYQDWECIVVDDGSTDYTEELLGFYIARDCRIRYVKRPSAYKKGANACRNYGFKISKGDYIQWFDSDDLMLPDFLLKKANTLITEGVEFVISKTHKFKDPNPKEIVQNYHFYYRFNEFELNPYNYITQKINWLTPDFFAKRSLVENIKFNEKLNSAQERNFFSKLICNEPSGYFIDEYLTLQRSTQNSIQNRLRNDKKNVVRESLRFYLETWLDIGNTKFNDSKEYLFSEAVKKTFLILPSLSCMKELTVGFFKKGKIKAGLWFFLYHSSMRIFGRGIFFRDRFREASDILKPTEED